MLGDQEAKDKIGQNVKTKCETKLLGHVSSQFCRELHSMFSDVLLIITLVCV